MSERHVFALRMGEFGVPRAEVDRGNAHGAEPSNIGPPELRIGAAADRLEEGGGSRQPEPWRSRRRRVDHDDLEAVEELSQVRLRLLETAIWRESVVDPHGAAVRHDIAGHPTGD